MAESSAATPDAAGAAAADRAVRLTFEYVGDEVRLVAQQRLTKRTPPSDPTSEARMRDLSGFWIEVRDTQDQTLYRRIMSDPIQTSVEVRSEDPDHPLVRVPVDQPRGTFSVIVPDLPEGDAVVLFGNPAVPPAARATLTPAREIARFELATGPNG